MPTSKGKYFNRQPGKTVVLYNWLGIDCIRSHPAKVFMSNAMLQQQALLRVSTRMAASFRTAFTTALPFPAQLDMQTRFRMALLQGLAADNSTALSEALAGFEFNKDGPLSDRLTLPLTLTPLEDRLLLHMPSFVPSAAIRIKAAVSTVQFHVLAACCHSGNGQLLASSAHSFSLPYQHSPVAARDISLQLPPASNSLSLLVLSLRIFCRRPAIG